MKNKKVIRNKQENLQRGLAKLEEYDTYIILYFKEDCNYSEGFKNEYRNNISFIIERENNTKLNSEETLFINKNFGIEIHFNSIINNLNYFFSRNYDENMKYLISIDFSNFDSSLITNTRTMFEECILLESINLLNFNTSSVIYMDSMFKGCTSLQSINLSNFDTSSVIDMANLFYNCNSLKSINLLKFNT